MLTDGAHHPVLPAAEVARQKGCEWQSVQRAIEAGQLHGYQAGGAWLVHNDAALDAWTPKGTAGRPRTKQRRPARSAALKLPPEPA